MRSEKLRYEVEKAVRAFFFPAETCPERQGRTSKMSAKLEHSQDKDNCTIRASGKKRRSWARTMVEAAQEVPSGSLRSNKRAWAASAVVTRMCGEGPRPRS